MGGNSLSKGSDIGKERMWKKEKEGARYDSESVSEENLLCTRMEGRWVPEGPRLG